jgi:dTDP-4-dehydrorhamnose 3,5-epimerase
VRFLPTELPEVVVVEPDVWRDGRGYFLETYHAPRYRAGGIDAVFVQDNRSRSTQGTLRGLHAQRTKPQGKLVQVVEGAVFDVAVDIRRGSPTFLRWVGVPLSAEDARQVWVPAGFAHGFCVTSDHAVVEYKCTDLYDPSDEIRIAWDDPQIGIRWPVAAPVLSPKDRDALPVSRQMDSLPRHTG